MGQHASLLAQLLPETAPVKHYVHPSQYREVPNVRHYSDGMHKQYQPNLCTLAISILTLGLYISVPHLLLGLMLASFFSRAAAITLLLLMASLAIPAKPLRVPQVLSSYLFLCWRRYFKFSYLFEVSLDSYQDYVVAQFPHGAFPLGALIGGTFMATQYPEYPCYALAANAAFMVPVWRHVHAWLGTEACTKTNFHKLLGKGVKGPLAHKHSRTHHSLGEQQQHDEVTATAEAAAAAQGTARPDSASGTPGQQQRSPKPIGGTPFNSCAAALAAAADGVTAEPAAAAAAVAQSAQLYGPFASAAIISSTLTGTMTEAAATAAAAGGGGGGSSSGFVAPRRTSSAPLGRRLSLRALSLTSSMFKGGHTLSDTDSSDSSDSEGEGEGDEACWEACCGCGSGLRCRDPEACGGRAANNINSISWGRGYSSDGGSSRSSSDGSICSCCGACTVLAEVHSLPPMDSFMRKQLQQQQPSVLVTIPSDETTAADAAAVEFDQRDQDSNSLSSTPLLLGQQQQQIHHHHHQQQQKQQQVLLPHTLSHQQSLHSTSSQVLRHDQTNPTNWRVDPTTGARKLGVSVGLMVGGIAEMFMIRRDHERIKLKDRKGFIRVSLEHGVDILPVYMFGVNQALDFGPPWLQRLSRRMRASLGMIYGVWGLPIPRRVPIFMVTGRPLTVGVPMRKDHPDFAAKVDELHAKFCEEIERLYYTHRAKYGHGFENRPLVIC